MARLEAAGKVQHCSELRACGSFVCEYEILYTDDGEPLEIEELEEEEQEGGEENKEGS